GKAVVDLVVTELAVFSIDRALGRMTLMELAPGVSLEEVREKTEAEYEVALAVQA
ncbi:succinyl-CoA--3-ketoacid-CoA transferase, partial [Roseomonas sp. 1311]|nr:succinyl-CoA--3-ketoacid-CoA transferase [Roseomonas marmotae]